VSGVGREMLAEDGVIGVFAIVETELVGDD
jgi:hypothetical protein